MPDSGLHMAILEGFAPPQQGKMFQMEHAHY
jgi:hypothetical protein